MAHRRPYCAGILRRLAARSNGKLVGYTHEGWEISSRPDPYVVAGVEESAHLYAFGAVAWPVFGLAAAILFVRLRYERMRRAEVARELRERGANPENNLDAGFHIKDPEGISVQLVGA